MATLTKPTGPLVWIFLGFLLFVLGYAIAETTGNRDIQRTLEGFESRLNEAEVVRNQNLSLEKSISRLETENDDLKSLIVELRARPAEIRYITKTETKIVAAEPEARFDELPEEHLHTLETGTVVARFAQEEDQFVFNTYDLDFRNTMVITDSKTAASLQLKSSYDDEWVEVPIDVEVSNIRDQKLFEPHIGVGGTIGTYGPSGSAFVSLLHPWDAVDVGSVRLSVGSHVGLGIDPIGYNLGEPLPVLTDLWVFGGATAHSNGMFSADVTIGSKF